MDLYYKIVYDNIKKHKIYKIICICTLRIAKKPGNCIMKKPISATIDEDLIEWIKSQTADKTKYRNKSHVIEVALEILRRESKKSKQK